MSSRIVKKEALIPGQTSRLIIHAPQIADKALPGNFIILRVSAVGERIPLTIADTDTEAGTITIVYLVLGKTTAALEALKEGDSVHDLCGPLGKPTHIEKTDGTVICVGGGTGIAAMHHIAKGHHQAGNHVVSIIGARNKDLLLYHEELCSICAEVPVSTNDGSFGEKGLVTDLLLKRLQEEGGNIAEVVAIGPVPMMEAVVKTVQPFGVPVTVSLNSIMVDGIGMCGACRVTVGGEVKFTCVDGPEFDGYKVDFKELQQRLATFRDQERHSHDDFCTCLGDNPPKKPKKETPKRIPMPCQPAADRITNFREVALGYSPGQAMLEAKRCLQCKKPLCVKGCPVEVPIRDFIKAIVDGDLPGAYAIIKQTNSLPAVCGRVCPQEVQCEGACVLNAKGEPIAIGRLERFVADSYLTSSACQSLLGSESCAIPDPALKVACIGSGPASLTTAGYLAGLGISVTVFEALHEVGGVLIYGIPEFRLPKQDIVGQEVAVLKQLGVEFVTNYVGGKTVKIQELFDQGYKAVFIGVGAGLPKFLEVPGESLIGVFSANEYLTRVNLGRAYDFPLYDTPIYPGRNVTVFGGGNVAMDAARTALRLGAESVRIVYRRTRDEMPARHEELEHAEEEGVKLELLCAPLGFTGDENGRLTAVTLQRMELGEPDASGRRSPKPIPDDTYTLPTDLAVIAVGTNANPVLLEATPGLKLNKWGYIEANEHGETSLPNVFAGGDIVSGAATVILAMGAGRTAAKEIARRLGRGAE